jgi:hypothetical protein
MKCEYGDGFKVEYEGSLRVTKGDEVNLYVKESFIPSDIKSEFEAAALHNSCGELRHAAQEATATFKDAWYGEFSGESGE